MTAHASCAPLPPPHVLDDKTFVVEYHTPADNLGRRRFTLHWLTDYVPGCPCGPLPQGTLHYKAQVFFTQPEKCFAPLRARGMRILEHAEGSAVGA